MSLPVFLIQGKRLKFEDNDYWDCFILKQPCFSVGNREQGYISFSTFSPFFISRMNELGMKPFYLNITYSSFSFC